MRDSGTEWMGDGNCVSEDPDQFHRPERTHRRGIPARPDPEVEAICLGCDVRVECLAYAVREDMWGVWGGTTRQQREVMRRDMIRAKCPVCQGAHLAHRSGQQVCLDCGTSWAATRYHSQARASPVAA